MIRIIKIMPTVLPPTQIKVPNIGGIKRDIGFYEFKSEITPRDGRLARPPRELKSGFGPPLPAGQNASDEGSGSQGDGNRLVRMLAHGTVRRFGALATALSRTFAAISLALSTANDKRLRASATRSPATSAVAVNSAFAFSVKEPASSSA